MDALKRVTRRLVERRWLVTLGHYAVAPIVLCVVAMRVAAVLWGYLACYAVGAVMLPFLVALYAHGSGICGRGRCGVLMSTEPSTEAAKHRWWLHHVHNTLRSKLTWAIIAAWFVTTFVLASPIASIVPVLALLAVELRAIRLHSRLRPWCPYCNGRGPDDDPSPEPPPPGGFGRGVPGHLPPVYPLPDRERIKN